MYKFLSNICCEVYLYVQRMLLGIINVDFENCISMQLVRILKMGLYKPHSRVPVGKLFV